MSNNKFWTQDLIDVVLTKIKQSKTLAEALEQVGEETGKHLTYSQVRHAFKRFDLDTPASYLGRDIEDEFLEALARDAELLTRPYYMGGVGASQGSAQAQLETRLGVPLDYIDEELSVDLKEAVRDLIDERERRKMLRAEARSNAALQDRLADLHTAMRKSLRFVKQNHTKIELTTESTDSSCVLFCPLTDLHVGKVHKDRFGNVVFNRQILRNRMGQIALNIADQVVKNKPKELLFWIGGDLFEAILGNMRKGQAQKMDAFGQDAFEEARALIIATIDTVIDLTDFQGKVHLFLTAGNHDRLTEEKEYSSEDFMMFMFADSLACHMPDVSVNALTPIGTLLVEGVELILLHGHRNRLSNEAAINTLINNQGMTQKRKLVLQGHYHNLRWLSGKNWDCVTLPSICGNDDFTQYDINKFGEPKHCIFVISNGEARMIGPYLL